MVARHFIKITMSSEIKTKLYFLALEIPTVLRLYLLIIETERLHLYRQSHSEKLFALSFTHETVLTLNLTNTIHRGLSSQEPLTCEWNTASRVKRRYAVKKLWKPGVQHNNGWLWGYRNLSSTLHLTPLYKFIMLRQSHFSTDISPATIKKIDAMSKWL